MPIKRLQRGGSQFPCIGKLRKGGKRPENGRAPGKDLEYFRFDTDDQQALANFQAAYGTEADTITVYLPYNTTDENFSAWQEEWTASSLQHRCDGDTCTMWLDKATGKYSTEPKPCPGGCKEVGRLQVIIPELQRFAYVAVETHSLWDIMTLDENLRAVESMRGSLQGIPFILKRRPKEISTPSGKDGSRARRTKWLLSIEVDPAWAAARLANMHQRAISAAAGALTLNGEAAQLTVDYSLDFEEARAEGASIADGDYIDADLPDSLADVDEDPALAVEAADDADEEAPADDERMMMLTQLAGNGSGAKWKAARAYIDELRTAHRDSAKGPAKDRQLGYLRGVIARYTEPHRDDLMVALFGTFKPSVEAAGLLLDKVSGGTKAKPQDVDEKWDACIKFVAAEVEAAVEPVAA